VNIIITGGLGMVGSNLVANLSKTNKVFVIDNNIRQMKDYSIAFIKEHGELDNVTLLEEDVREFDHSKIDRQIDIFFHLADIVAGIGYVFNNQYEILTENIEIDKAAFELAKTLAVTKVVYASTACVFNQNAQRSIDSKLKIDRDLFPAFPESTYGWAKLYGQLLLQNLFEDQQYKVVFFHNMIGTPCDFSSDKSQMVPSICNRLQNQSNNELIVWGSGEQGRAFVPVKTAARFLSNLYNTWGDIGSLQQFGPMQCTTVNEVAETLITNFMPKCKIVHDLTKPEGDIGRSVDQADSIVEISKEQVSSTIIDTYRWIAQQKLTPK
jgi:GDP-D-mannose 3', 5'-epimerase